MDEVGSSAHLLVHCQGGFSRSPAAMALILAQAFPAIPSDCILREVVRIRPRVWPNLRLIELGDLMLSDRNDLLPATDEIYSAQLLSRPGLAERMIGRGRGREVARAQELSSKLRPPSACKQELTILCTDLQRSKSIVELFSRWH